MAECLKTVAQSEDDEDESIDFIRPLRSADVIMHNFKDWLMSVDGQHKNECNAQQCSRQVLHILNTLHILKYMSP